MDGGEITREDLKTELLTNWDEDVLQKVGKRCGVELAEGISKEEAAERLLDDAPLEKLLEQLLQWELSGGDEDGDEGEEAAAAAEAASMIAEADQTVDGGDAETSEGDGDAEEAGDLGDDEMPEGPDPDDPTLSRVEQEALSQAADALSMLDVEIQSTVQEPDTPLEGMPDSAATTADGDADEMGPEDVPREALEAELQANWAADEVRALAEHFSIEVDGRGKDEIVAALLDDVSRTVLIQEMLSRESGGGGEEEDTAEAPSAVPSAIPVPASVPESSTKPEPEPEPEAEPEPEPAGKSPPSYDDSNLLRELRSMRRETDYADDEFDVEEDGGSSPLIRMGLAAAVILGGVFLLTSEGGRKPPLTPTPTEAPTTVAVDPSGTTTGSTSVVTAGTTTDASDPSSVTTMAEVPDPSPSATPTPVATESSGRPAGTPTPVASTTPATPAASPTEAPPAATPTGTPSEAPSASPSAPPEATPESTSPAGPPGAVALRDQAVAAEENGDLGRAIFNGIRALERGGVDWSAREQMMSLVSRASYELGERAFQEGQTDKALVELRRSIEYGPDNSDSHFTLGRCYERLKEFGLAIEAYSEAVRSRPDFGRAHAYLAYAYRAKKMYPEAEHHASLAQKHGEDLDPGFLFLLRYRPTPKPGR